MKKINLHTLFCFLFLLMASTLKAADWKPDYGGSWSFLYGKGYDYNELNYKPEGNTYKFILGVPMKRFELGVMARLAHMNTDVVYNSTSTNIELDTSTIGAHFGFWFFSWFKIHVGYARHTIQQDSINSLSYSDDTRMRNLYNVADRKAGGFYGGADLAVINFKSFQIYTSADYFKLNTQREKQLDLMVGLRIFTKKGGSSSSSGESSFTKVFKSMIDAFTDDK